MKVFYIDPQSYNNLSLYDYSLLKNIDGHDIMYFCNKLYQSDYCEKINYIKIFTYSEKKSSLAKGLSYFISIINILFHAFIKRPDIVHIQWLRIWLLDYVFVWALKLLNIRVVFTAHNVLPHEPRPGDFGRYKRYYMLVHDIIVHNQRTKEELVHDFDIDQEKISVIHHGILANSMDKSVVEERVAVLKKDLGITDDMVIFSCMGIQTEYKGIDMVVRAWSEIKELHDNSKCMLLLVGRNRGIDYTPLKDFHNVYIQDEMISDLDFEAFLQISSLTLLPYRKISQSGVLFTAVSSGVPVLVSDVGGLTEPFQYGEIGWDIGEPSYENLKNKMVCLASNKEEISNIRKKRDAFEKVCQAYSWESIGRKTADLYTASAI